MEKVYLVYPDKKGEISPGIYGVFAEHLGGVIYDGIYCGENSKAENIRGFRKFIIDRMRDAKIPLIRWPGGCFAETYDWRDGIGPRSERPVRINWWTHLDSRYEPNLVGTDEFLDFCSLCGAEPYIAANLTSTTPLDIRDWIDYCNSPAGTTTLAALREKNGHREPYNVRLWGVGNENWGGGGNMTPEFYANEYRRYATVMGNSSKSLELIACGADSFDYNWTRVLLDSLHRKGAQMNGYAFHYYCGGAGDTVNFTDDEWNQLIAKAGKMQELIDRHWAAVVSYGMEKNAKLCIDEWGCWHPGGTGPSKGANLFEQQSTMRDAVISALTLNIFNNNCDKIKLAAVAQLVNCLHALFLVAGEECILTPTYHVFEMYKNHQGASAVGTVSENGDISVSASVKDGKATVTLANLSCVRDLTVKLQPLGCDFGNSAEIAILGDGDVRAHNTFDSPERVKTKRSSLENFDGTIEIPRGGVAAVTVACAGN
jgi:alpha-N-arabinofuranosidase